MRRHNEGNRPFCSRIDGGDRSSVGASHEGAKK